MNTPEDMLERLAEISGETPEGSLGEFSPEEASTLQTDPFTTEPEPIVFTDREGFLARRDEVISRVIGRLEADPDFEHVLLAEIYAGSIETRLVADELARALAAVNAMMTSGGGKLIARAIGRGMKGE